MRQQCQGHPRQVLETLDRGGPCALGIVIVYSAPFWNREVRAPVLGFKVKSRRLPHIGIMGQGAGART
jgi:hypothetical protein